MSKSIEPGPSGLSHIGIHSEDPAALAEFYRDVLDMQIVGSSAADSPVGASTFLSSRPNEESHEIVIFANSDLRHTAFKVASLADLRARYRSIKGRGVPIKATVNHGVSLAFYFDDPEGNGLEIYYEYPNARELFLQGRGDEDLPFSFDDPLPEIAAAAAQRRSA